MPRNAAAMTTITSGCRCENEEHLLMDIGKRPLTTAAAAVITTTKVVSFPNNDNMDVLCTIFGYLDWQDIVISVRNVCTTWKEACRYIDDIPIVIIRDKNHKMNRHYRYALDHSNTSNNNNNKTTKNTISTTTTTVNLMKVLTNALPRIQSFAISHSEQTLKNNDNNNKGIPFDLEIQKGYDPQDSILAMACQYRFQMPLDTTSSSSSLPKIKLSIDLMALPNFKNLKHLNLSHGRLNGYYPCLFSRNMLTKQLISLDISHNPCLKWNLDERKESSRNDEQQQYQYQSKSTLKHLYCGHNVGITGQLSNLIRLFLSSSTTTNSTKNCSLETLSMPHCPNIHGDLIDDIWNYCPAIISMQEQASSLKKVNVNGCIHITGDVRSIRIPKSPRSTTTMLFSSFLCKLQIDTPSIYGGSTIIQRVREAPDLVMAWYQLVSKMKFFQENNDNSNLKDDNTRIQHRQQQQPQFSKNKNTASEKTIIRFQIIRQWNLAYDSRDRYHTNMLCHYTMAPPFQLELFVIQVVSNNNDDMKKHGSYYYGWRWINSSRTMSCDIQWIHHVPSSSDMETKLLSNYLFSNDTKNMLILSGFGIRPPTLEEYTQLQSEGVFNGRTRRVG